MVFFLLIVMLVFASFVIILNQNTGLEQTTIQTRQMDNTVAREQVRVTPNGADFLTGNSAGSNSVTVNCNLNNTGTVPIWVVRVWVEDMSTKASASMPLNNVVQQGQIMTIPATTVSVQITDPSKTTFWFVTARGNLFNQYTNAGQPGPQGPKGDANTNNALVAQGIGSISMIFDSFTHYEFGNTNPIGKNLNNYSVYSSNFTLTSNGYTLLHVAVLNVDPDNETIWLDGNSTIYILGSHANTVKYDYWRIVSVSNGVVSAYSSSLIVPSYNQTSNPKVDLYFYNGDLRGINPSSSASVYPLNIELFGRKGTTFATSSEYGQNIPFEPIYIR